MIDREKLETMVVECCNTRPQRTAMFALIGELETLALRVKNLEAKCASKPETTKKVTKKTAAKSGGED
jgi:hypothetical protein